jgi:hypothetical protein
MRASYYVLPLVAAIGAVAAMHWGSDAPPASRIAQRAAMPASTSRAIPARAVGRIATLRDVGELLSYGNVKPVARGATTWHEVAISEDHALNAISTGTMTIQAPDGHQIRLQHVRHVDGGDGNWTFVGRPQGAAPGQEAILTFGDKAVFGTIPNGRGLPMEVTTTKGKTYLVETDNTRLSDKGPQAAPTQEDFVVDIAPKSAATSSTGAAITDTTTLGTAAAKMLRVPSAAALRAEALTGTAPAIDLVVGYTTGFSARLGGRSQAATRLNFMIAVVNEAYANSQVDAQVRLVRTIEVDYPDATSNRNTLFELSGVACTASSTGGQLPDGAGVSCTSATVPAALRPIIAARNEAGADLASLVRTLHFSENGSCGISWVLGWGQSNITQSDAARGLSVISDSSGAQFPDAGNTCRDDTLAHELGHNMGLQHDRATAAGTTDTNGDTNLLDPEEFGRFPYSFGYVAPADQGNFYDIMSPRRTGMSSVRVFSNPRISTCFNFPCGVADVADSARTLTQTMPVVATFGTAPTGGVGPLVDLNGDHRADVFWSNRTAQQADWWLMNGVGASYAGSMAVPSQYHVAGLGDFDGDGRGDILWEDGVTIWLWHNEGNGYSVQFVANHPGNGWQIAGVGDLNGDNKVDIVWNNRTLQQADWWIMDGANWAYAGSKSVPAQYHVAAIADFDGDHHADILWEDGSTLWIWHADAAGFSIQFVANHPGNGWAIAGTGDFNADGKADLFWSNRGLQRADLWLMNGPAWAYAGSTSVPAQYRVAGIGDFNADGRADVLWEDGATIWTWLRLANGTFSANFLSDYPSNSWAIVH